MSLPKGGGAIRGIGEKFSANPVTGTGSMSIPLATSPGRSGFGPQLLLSYDSGAGNGPFGFGWRLSLPAITRKTDKGLPTYVDVLESDVFVLGGAEDLVPVLVKVGGKWRRETPRELSLGATKYEVFGYTPRIEGAFARIERWTSTDGRDTFWRTISRDNITTFYGKTPEARVVDLAHPERIFSWLVCETHDDKGNVTVYEYQREDARNVDASQAHEQNRRHSPPTANTYVKRIKYGNTPSRLVDGDLSGLTWCFDVVFDYGDGHYAEQAPDAQGRIFATAAPQAAESWPVRADPFSSYRAGFEVRTYRLCERVLMFHRFSELGAAPVLVRSTELEHVPAGGATFLRAAIQSGYAPVPNLGLLKRSLPPLQLDYSPSPCGADLGARPLLELPRESLENLPEGIGGTAHQWVDLDGEGLSGVLTEQSGAWSYKRNLGGGRFGVMRPVPTRPTIAERGTHRLMDLAGDGHLDVVVADAQLAGIVERTGEDDWDAFRPFASAPNVSWHDPNVRFLDLTGDGLADLVVSEHEAFVWYRSLGEDGFAPAERVCHRLDEEQGPSVAFADATQTIFLADMSGDGLTDLVRIRNGEICYWPNLGYARFGPKITMDRAPWFDRPERFDPKRIRLADFDGSGVTDILYLHPDAPVLYFNHAGNGWSAGTTLPQFPRVDELSNVQVLDLLGTGTSCLVWSSPLPGDAGRPLRYLDLMGGVKPHLLIASTNNLGGRTSIEYAPSTRFYLEDRAAGRPWVTRLPFPVHVVARVTVADQWRGTHFSSTYSYHHGHFDGAEREFRGFGRVEQIDVEDYGTFAAGNVESPYVTPDHTLYQPPVKTVTWFHTGAALDPRRVLSQFASEYFPARFPNQVGFAEKVLSEPELDAELADDEWREALRACKGMTLRQEIYELDVDTLGAAEPRAVRLFSAATHNCTIRRLQPRGGNQHAVFLVSESEAVSYQYELDLRPATLEPDPRVGHTLNLSFDDRGNVQQSIAIAYPRRHAHADATLGADLNVVHVVQNERHVAYSETRYTIDVIEPAAGPSPLSAHRLSLPCEALSYEVTGLATPAGDYFDLDELRGHAFGSWYPPRLRPGQQHAVDVKPLAYHERATGPGVEMRLVEHGRTLFWKDDLSGPLALGELATRALKYEGYKLALTTDLLTAVFGQKLADRLGDPAAPAATALDRVNRAASSGYARPAAGTPLATLFRGAAPDEYWTRSGIAGFAADAAAHFFIPERYEDPFGHVTTLTIDAKYDLFVQATSDARGNTTTIAEFDYRILAPREVIDANGNGVEARFDALGALVATALKDKAGGGDNFTDFDASVIDPSPASVGAFCAATTLDETRARDWLLGATTRFVYHFGETRDAGGDVLAWAVQPASACGIAREIHAAAPGGVASPLQVSLEASDGTGAVLMKKVQAEPDPTTGSSTLRWIVNGKTVLNNKGKPVKQYQPYFSDRFGVESIDSVGVTPLLYYDAAGRLMRTELPDGTLTRVEFSPWHVNAFDANDTVLESLWYQQRGRPDPNLPLPAGESAKVRAAWLAAHHADTPSVKLLDSLGRDVVGVAHNRVKDAAGGWQDQRLVTFTKLDAEGKPLWIQDARGNIVMRYTVPRQAGGDPLAAFFPTYDVAGNLLYQHSMDAGERWTLSDAAGKPMLSWDVNERQVGAALVSEHRLYAADYDELHRPTAQWARIGGGARVAVERFAYRDAVDNDAAAKTNNLQGQLVRHYDPSGLVEVVRRDFKGNTLETLRRLGNAPKASVVDWQGNLAAKLEAETFVQRTEVDALNRMTRHYNWHRGVGSRVAVYEPVYNRRGALTAETLTVRAQKTAGGFSVAADTTTALAIREIRCDAKGQRQFLELGNATVTGYDYDPLTFRLTHLQTGRPQDGRVLQKLTYTYDPVGNVTEIHDEAYEPVFFQNQKVEPRAAYEYDALYRLTSASGRENGALRGAPTSPGFGDLAKQFPVSATNVNALRNYEQTFQYDEVGNLREVAHAAGLGSWTRHLECQPDSNRLLRTWEGAASWNGNGVVNPTRYAFDTHGNMLNAASVAPGQFLRWDHRDMIARLDLVGGGWAYYQYDAGKQRTRKRLERAGGVVEERIYLGGYEVYRRYDAAGAMVEEIESLHLTDGRQRVLLVDDVIVASTAQHLRPDGLTVRKQTLLRYQYSNHLGSACSELDAQGGVISYEEYHPYGTTAYRATKGGIEAPPKRYRYTGMERDEESGLGYHTARYYAPWLSRWASTDPARHDLATCQYCYAASNPLRLTDHLGEAPIPQGETAETLLDTASGIVRGTRSRHLDQRTAQALFIEAQGGGVVDPVSNNYFHHVDDIERDLKSARRTTQEIDTILGDKKISIKSSLRENLVHARRQVQGLITRAENTLEVAGELNRNPEYSKRLSGIRLQPGPLVEESLLKYTNERGLSNTSLLPKDVKAMAISQSTPASLPVTSRAVQFPTDVTTSANPPEPVPTPIPEPLVSSATSAASSEGTEAATALVSEAETAAGDAAGQLARAESTVGGLFFAVGAAIGVGFGIKHHAEGKDLRAITDIASITGLPLTLVPDALNVAMSYSNYVFNLMAISEGANMGVQSMWTNIVIDPRDYGRVAF